LKRGGGAVSNKLLHPSLLKSDSKGRCARFEVPSGKEASSSIFLML